jgi:hypothetical protein
MHTKKYGNKVGWMGGTHDQFDFIESRPVCLCCWRCRSEKTRGPVSKFQLKLHEDRRLGASSNSNSTAVFDKHADLLEHVRPRRAVVRNVKIRTCVRSGAGQQCWSQ